MKKIKLIAISFSLIVFSACVDTEETIVINADNTGVYTITGDMGKLFDVMKNFKGMENTGTNKFSDSTVYFKDIVDQSNLSESEKDLYRPGSFRMRVNEEKKEMKIIISCSFRNMNQLKELKMNLFNIMDRLDPKKEQDELAKDHKEMVKTIFPFTDQYNFDAQSGKISNAIIDISAFKSKLAEDSTSESMQEMQASFGESHYKTTFILPKPVKKYNGPNAVLSNKKKTITFFHTNKEMADNPAQTVYSVEY